MVDRIRSRAKNIFERDKLTNYLLYLIVILVVVYSVVRLDRGLHSGSLRLIVLLAAVFGWLLAFLKRPNPILIIVTSFLGGVVTSFIIFGNLAQPLIEFLQTPLAVLPSDGQGLFKEVGFLPDTSLWQAKLDLLQQAVQVLFDRLWTWLSALPEPAYDPVSMNLIWGIVLWIITIWTYWFVFKKTQVLLGFLPPLLVVAGVFRTVDEGVFGLFFVLGIGLYLLISANQERLESFWNQHGFSFSGMIRNTITQNAVLLSLGLVIFSSLITSPKIDEFIDDLKQRRQQTGESSQSGSAQVDRDDLEGGIGPSDILGEALLGNLPNEHLVGSGPELQEIEVMDVRIIDQDLQLDDRYYLRSATYDTYKVDGWLTVDKGVVYYPPEEEFEIDFTPNEKLIFQEVTFSESVQQGNLMVAVGEMAAADVFYYASFHTKFVNNTYTDLFASVTEAAQYSAYSIAPYFVEDELRSTSLDYPDWIANKYLQVPDSVPDRVYELALSLTATQPTQYDRALAIEQYLRQFEYTLDLEEPPAYRDVVDYFIFELQKGYCDYFASSMVVLARAAGIPARLATGYLAGTYDPELNRYVVTADQAHSWAEVYFTDYGWVTFEPTSGRPALERPQDREIMPEELASEVELNPASQNADPFYISLLPNNLFVLLGQLLIVLSIGLVAVYWIDRWMLEAMATDRMFAQLYQRLRKRAKGLGVKIRDTDTPLEFSELLTAYLNRHGTNKLSSRLMASARQHTALIVGACNQAAYAKNMPGQEEVRRVILAWGRLRWQLILARILIRVMPIGAEIRRVWTRLQQPA